MFRSTYESQGCEIVTVCKRAVTNCDWPHYNRDSLLGSSPFPSWTGHLDPGQRLTGSLAVVSPRIAWCGPVSRSRFVTATSWQDLVTPVCTPAPAVTARRCAAMDLNPAPFRGDAGIPHVSEDFFKMTFFGANVSLR